MKKTKKQVLVLAATLSLCLGAVIGAKAINTLVDIKAQLNYGITVEYNGETKTITDATGALTAPITYNSTTYLPVRAIANLLNVPINWDGTTQTVQLGSTDGGVDLIDNYAPYYYTTGSTEKFTQVQTTDKEKQSPEGLTLSHWIQMDALQEQSRAIGSYKIGNQYKTVTFRYLSKYSGTLKVLGNDGIELSSIPLIEGQVAQTATVSLMNNSELSFKLERETTMGVSVYLFDVILK